MGYLNEVAEFIVCFQFWNKGVKILCPCDNCVYNVWVEIEIASKYILWKGLLEN